ncbi:MAG TPA: hypothetical protein VEX18_11585, partial [Polyangiaceae bacterium]|nr:hypothetical protein [Polyangiaceae bacterium]
RRSDRLRSSRPAGPAWRCLHSTAERERGHRAERQWGSSAFDSAFYLAAARGQRSSLIPISHLAILGRK